MLEWHAFGILIAKTSHAASVIVNIGDWYKYYGSFQLKTKQRVVDLAKTSHAASVIVNIGDWYKYYGSFQLKTKQRVVDLEY